MKLVVIKNNCQILLIPNYYVFQIIMIYIITKKITTIMNGVTTIIEGLTTSQTFYHKTINFYQLEK